MQAREFLRQGNSAKARECFQKCVDVTSEMALDLIKVCRARNIDCIVAPYEADAQLAYLSLQSKSNKQRMFQLPTIHATFKELLMWSSLKIQISYHLVATKYCSNWMPMEMEY